MLCPLYPGSGQRGEFCQAQNHQLRTAFQYGIAFETMNGSRTNQRRRTMGKAAFNERLKLAATYWNNISAGLTLTGLIIPYLALNYWIVDLIAWVPDWLDGKAKLSDPAIVAAVSTVVATVAAYVAASACRSFADRLLIKIQD